MEMEKEIKRIVLEFLSKHGGMDNGYSTFVEGVVNKRIGGRLRFRTRDMDDMTFDQYRNLAKDLYLKINRILTRDGNFDEVVFTKQHLEHSCFITHIKFSKLAGII